MITYLCPKCKHELHAMCIATLPPIHYYECYWCGYRSKEIYEDEQRVVLPVEYQNATNIRQGVLQNSMDYKISGK